jgi:UDP-N-acetylglucosamine--N-acetylmuramyl-(pentapeptide) pyrophosphoryl-undecaprenol N-acetylglucosamine transferase
MPARFAAADLIVCRAGATTVAEIAAARRAAILVPFAGAAEDHQTRNARELETAGAAESIPEGRLTPEFLAGRVLHYLDHPEDLDAMAARLAPLGAGDAAGKIARLAIDLMDGAAKETSA